MRAFGILVALALACPSEVFANEAEAHVVAGQVPLTTDEHPASYTHEWQRRLLAAQLEFVATLSPEDAIQTGSVTRSDR